MPKLKIRRDSPLWSILSGVRYGLMIVLVFALAWGVYMYRDEINIDNFRRLASRINFGGGASNGDGTFALEPDSSGRYILSDGLFAAAGTHGIDVFDSSGGELYSVADSLASPALRSAKDLILAFDVGARRLLLLSGSGQEASNEWHRPIISADINEKGNVAVVSEESGYKSSVTVLDSKMNESFRYRSSELYLMDAAVSDDNSRLAAVGFSYISGGFSGKLVVLSLEKEEQLGEFGLSGALPVSVFFFDASHIGVLSDSGFVITDENANFIGSYAFEGMELRAYSCDGEGYMTILLNRGRAGRRFELITIDKSGEILAQVHTNEEIFAVSAAGGFIATASGEGIRVYDKQLSLKTEHLDAGEVVDVLMRKDGTLVAVGRSGAATYRY